VDRALSIGDEGLCVSFQEPTILTDWAVDLFMIGQERRLYCCYVSNGYMTLEALKLLKESGMDGLKIDLKGDAETYKRYCGGVDVEKVWRNIREAKRLGIHVEVVNLIVTNVNDNEECLGWIIERHLRESGADTPLHFIRYYPAYKLHNPPPKVETLERAYEMAVEAGIHYPYLGNVRGHRYENTYCPNCGESLIRRRGYTIIEYNVSPEKRCPRCSQSIPITGSYVQRNV
jgi:pyruvate formate lyase activating enzyme